MSNFIENHSNDEIVIPPDGKVQLEEKRCPLFEREDLVKINDGDWAFTRAYIDISPLKQKLSKLPEEVWTDEGQSSNIKLTRPAHDIWGIKKIVFVYCDDFLQKVYNFPWSESHEWKDLLIPIYKAINISEHQVVRCLLANMSPGCVIPVHHDTGYWVKYTHRMHLAIETGERVEFRVGPTDDRLKRISFDEGRLVELNNQAKHAVVNNMKSCRIHLIFDYIDDHPIERVYLQPGEILHQTRRSIDRQTDKGKRKSPSFIIIGAQKSGTTSLYELICQHPLVLRGKRRETHFFDWRWNTSLTTPSTQHTYYMNFFDSSTLHTHPSLCTGESTPSYLLHSNIVIPRILQVCPYCRILVILRDPVSRAYSQYQMCIDKRGSEEQLQVRGQSSYVNMSFEEVIEREISELEAAGIQPDSSYELFSNKILSNLPMGHGGHSIIARGLYALQLIPWREAFNNSQLLILGSKDIQGGKNKVRETMNEVYDFIGLREYEVEDITAKNSREYIPIDEEIKKRLREFYKPYNNKLKEILGKEINW